MLSFGPPGERTEGEIYSVFGKWVDLYDQFPQKVFSFKSPYEAVEQLINPRSVIAVGQLIDQYLLWAKKAKMLGDETKNRDIIERTNRIKRFLEKYLDWPIADFGADELSDVQEKMKRYKYGKKEKQYTRRGINDNIKQLRAIWDWGIGREFVTKSQAKRLEEVKLLRIGEAIDIPKRKKVKPEEFVKVINNVNPVVADMLRLIWHTAMRPSEVCKMRPFDIIKDDPECWLYIPGRDQSPVGEHKTARFERIKVIPLTHECQKILMRRIKDFSSKDYVFSPKESMQEFLEIKAANRKTPLKYGNRPGTNKKEHPMINPGDKYEHHALRRACQRACNRAGVEVFTPYDLRRTMATGARATLGKEAAKVLLGHTKTDTTDIYLLEEVQEAMKVAKMLASSNSISLAQRSGRVV
jgi:integrase